MISIERITEKLGGENVEIFFFDELESTNTYACEIAKSRDAHSSVAVVISREQTAGKGTKGRGFFCKKDQGLYMSFVFHPVCCVDAAHLATPAAGVAVARALEQAAGVNVKIKWVNDIVVDDKKLCGILAESKLTPDRTKLEYLVVGIGINLYVEEFPQEIADTATSLNRHSAGFDVNELCACIIDNLSDYIAKLASGAFMDEYRQRSSVLGRYIKFENGGLTVTGKAVEINKQGNLVVELDDKRYIVSAGDISIKISGQ